MHMFDWRRPLAALSVGVFLTAGGWAQNSEAITTEARYVAILDPATGVRLYGKDADVAMVPASMSKLMTAYVVFSRLRDGRLRLEDTMTVSEDAWRRGGWASGGSTMSLKIGETPTVDDLLHGMIVHSGNDACIVLAEGISGSERAFADEMTRVAREELGFTTAQFRNATGLFDPDHKMTAAELAELSRRIIVDFPQFYSYYAETSFTWGGITQPNRNPLLGRMAGADGLKTGHLSQSGYGLAASAVRDGVRRIVVFNGMPSEQARAREAERLMRLAFDEFEVLSLYAQTPVAGRAPVVLGAAADVAIGPAEPVRLGVVRGRGGNLTARAELSGPIRAPVSAGQVLGELVVLDGAVEVTRVAMVAHEDVPKLGFLGKVWRGFSRTVLGHGEASVAEAPPVAAPAE